MSELSLRDALEEAFDEEEEEAELDGGAEEQVEEVAAEVEVETEVETAQEEVVDETTESSNKAEEESQEEEAAAELASDLKAPNSWKASIRENWKDVPKSAQAEIVRREREHDQLMQENAQHRGVAQEYQRVVEPYMNNIRAEGVTAAVAVENLLQTAASLQTGSALVKAQTITRLIGAYGVDIQTLSDVLTDKHVPTEEDRVQAEVERQMQPFNQQRQQQTQYEQQQQTQWAQGVKAETDAWSEGAEFVKEVGAHMADLLEMAGKRGEQLTLDEAYNKACYANDDIRAILQQREAAARAKAGQKNGRSKRRAGSSVNGSGAGSPAGQKQNTLRGALEEAWDENGRM